MEEVRKKKKWPNDKSNETLPFLATSISSSVQREVSPVSLAAAKSQKKMIQSHQQWEREEIKNDRGRVTVLFSALSISWQLI